MDTARVMFQEVSSAILAFRVAARLCATLRAAIAEAVVHLVALEGMAATVAAEVDLEAKAAVEGSMAAA